MKNVHIDIVSSMLHGPDTWITSSSNIEIWYQYNLDPILSLDGHKKAITSLKLTRENNIHGSTSEDYTIKL